MSRSIGHTPQLFQMIPDVSRPEFWPVEKRGYGWVWFLPGVADSKGQHQGPCKNGFYRCNLW